MFYQVPEINVKTKNTTLLEQFQSLNRNRSKMNTPNTYTPLLTFLAWYRYINQNNGGSRELNNYLERR